MRSLMLASCFLALLSFAFADTVKDRAGAVLSDRANMENDPRWIYNDFRRGFARATMTGKPLLVVLRCVPCLACAGIDAQVLREPELDPLLEQFVCVRLINANAIDLDLFQFDYDLSFSALFFNGDGTVYGRFGSWTHQKNPLDATTAGFKSALEGALAIHQTYPANKEHLIGKQGGPMPFKTPLQIPELASRYKAELDWEGKVVQSCVHCHQVGDAIRTSYREQNKPIPTRWIYPWPAPETIGLTLASNQAARVQDVVPGSPAAHAGLQPGDDLLSIDDQPLISIADVSWILHQAPDSGALDFLVQRQEAKPHFTVQLQPGWRSHSDIARRVGTWPMRAMALGGLLLEDLDDAARSQRNLAQDDLALLVKHVGQYGKHAAAKNAGFQKDDVIVALEGFAGRTTESEAIGRLLQTRQPGETVKTTVLRGEQRLDLALPIQ